MKIIERRIYKMMTKINYIPFPLVLIALLLMSSDVIAHNKVVVIPLNSSKTVSSKTITVPNDYSTIQGAITAANEGDTIIIHAGTYSETLIINKDNLTINGQNKETTIISGNNDAPTISIDNSKNISINNLYVNNGKIGILINFSSVYLLNSKIENNLKGLQVVSSSYINIDNTHVNSNHGIGLELKFNSTAYIDNSEFNNNTSEGIVSTMGSITTIQHSKMSYNIAGINSYMNTSAKIVDCEMKSNFIGLVLFGNSTGVLTGHNIISENGDAIGGAGIDVSTNSYLHLEMSYPPNTNLEVSANKGPGIVVSNNSSFLMEAGNIHNNQDDGISISLNSIGNFFHLLLPISIIGNNGYGIKCDDATIIGDVDKITFNNNALGDTNCP